MRQKVRQLMEWNRLKIKKRGMVEENWNNSPRQQVRQEKRTRQKGERVSAGTSSDEKSTSERMGAKKTMREGKDNWRKIRRLELGYTFEKSLAILFSNLQTNFVATLSLIKSLVFQ